MNTLEYNISLLKLLKCKDKQCLSFSETNTLHSICQCEEATGTLSNILPKTETDISYPPPLPK